MKLPSANRRSSVRLPAVLVAAFVALALAQAPAHAGLRHQMFELTNRARASHAKDALKMDWDLAKVARKHSSEMAEAGKLLHSSNLPGAIKARWTSWGENIGMTPTTLKDLQRAFMHSKVHKANILNSAFEKVGIGVVKDGDGDIWVTLIFYG